MRCYVHPGAMIVAICADCGAGVCTACLRRLGTALYCAADYAIARYDPKEEANPIMWSVGQGSVTGCTSATRGLKVGRRGAEGVEITLSPPSQASATRLLARTWAGDDNYPPGLERRRIDWVMCQLVIGLISLVGIVIYVSYRVSLAPTDTQDVCGAGCMIMLIAFAIFIMNIVMSRRWRRSNHPTVALVLSVVSAIASVGIGIWGTATLIGYYSASTYCAFGMC